MSRAEDRTTSAPTPPTRHKYGWCESVIISEIIQPYLIGLIQMHDPSTKTELLNLFREASKYETCSQSTLDGWLRDSGITAERRLEFSFEGDPLDEDPEAPVTDPASAGGVPSGPPATAGPAHGGLAIPGFNS